MLERRRTRVRALTQVWVVCREFTAPNFTHIGALRATAAVPSAPEAPGRFSTTKL
jgi:hypothetical protein